MGFLKERGASLLRASLLTVAVVLPGCGESPAEPIGRLSNVSCIRGIEGNVTNPTVTTEVFVYVRGVNEPEDKAVFMAEAPVAAVSGRFSVPISKFLKDYTTREITVYASTTSNQGKTKLNEQEIDSGEFRCGGPLE